jgi:hypothetical protein
MHVEIGAEAALFPENEYIKGFFVAVRTVPLSNFLPTEAPGKGIVCFLHKRDKVTI